MHDTPTIRRVADSVAEAGWLVALLSLPLYFTVLTPQGFEPDKAVLLRILAIVVGAAWLIGLVYDRWRLLSTARSSWLFWAGIALFASLCIATGLSIDPRLSLWGSDARQEGLWTDAAYVIFFVVVATRVRSQIQVERLISVILFGSLPVVIYGLLQQLGMDPLPAQGDPSQLEFRVVSTLGQHVFLGSYLIMVMPFTTARLLRSWQQLGKTSETGGQREIAIAAVATVLVVASFVGAIVLAVHSPALFVLLPGMFAIYAAVALLVSRILPPTIQVVRSQLFAYAGLLLLQVVVLGFSGARGAWLGFLAGIPVFAILLARHVNRAQLWKSILGVSAVAGVFIVVLNIPGGPLQPLRTVHGISRFANITDSGGGGGSAQGRKLIWQGVGKLMTQDPSIGNTWGGPARDIVGYGPETLHWAFESVFPLQLRQVTSEIWTWDRAHDIYLDYLVDAGLLGLLAFLATLGFLAVGLIRSLNRADSSAAWWLIAAASAVAAHLVDGIFGLETSVTLLLFWVLAGLTVARAGAEADEAEETIMPVPSIRSVVVPAAIVVVTAGALASIPGLGDHPAVLAAVWIAGTVAGVGFVAIVLGGPISVSRHFWRAPRLLVPVTLIALITTLALASQMRFETAAIADRRGEDLLATGQVQRALGLLETAGINNGYEPQYATDLGGAYLTLAARRPGTQDPPLYFTPNADKTLDPRIVNQLHRGDLLELSQLSLDSARSLAPLDPEVYANLGSLYLAWNQPSTALYDFQQAARLSVNNPRYLSQEALAQLAQNHQSDALALARQALSLDQTFWYSHFALALASNAAGNSTEARQQASAALGWVHNYWPPPPKAQVHQLQQLARSG